LLREHPGELWLIPHTFAAQGDPESDPEASRELIAELPSELIGRIRTITREYDQYELKWIIGKCGFFIGSRMHACIGALSQGIPCVGIAYSMKFEGVFRSVGVEDWVVDGRTSNAQQAVDRVLQLYRKRDRIKNKLSENAEFARVELFRVFKELASRAKICP
jgi:polysaccharide pyruvyl transferase WcaK-like protein